MSLATTQDKEEKTEEAEHDNVLKGVLFAISAFFLLAVMGACAKLLTQNHHVMEVAFFRNLVPFVLMTAYALALKKKNNFKVKNTKMIVIRVIVGTGGLITTFGALNALPISDATVIFMAANLILPILAYFVLGESVGAHRVLAIMIGFLGVFLVAAPTGQVNPIGLSLALGAACFHATVQIVLRRLKEENPFAVTYYFTLGGMLVTAAFLPWIATWPQTDELLLIFILGCSGGLAQYCLTSAFKNAPATIAAPFNYTGLLWATGLDIMIWGYIPSWQVYLGGAIIIGAKIYILHRERINKQKQNVLKGGQV